MLKKKLKKKFTIFFILYRKIPLVSSLENSPYFIFFQKIIELRSFVTSCFWGPAHCWYCKHCKTASDSLSEYYVLSKFGIGNIICHDSTALVDQYVIQFANESYLLTSKWSNSAMRKFQKSMLKSPLVQISNDLNSNSVSSCLDKIKIFQPLCLWSSTVLATSVQTYLIKS